MWYRTFAVVVAFSLVFPFPIFPEPSSPATPNVAMPGNHLEQAASQVRGFVLRLADALNIRLDSVTDDPGVNPPEVGPEGGTVDLPLGGELVIPSGALPSRSRFSRNAVELRHSNDLFRFNPMGDAIQIEARRSSDGTSVTRLQRSATLKLQVPDYVSPNQRPAIRILKAEWELVPSSYDAAAKTITVQLTELPATVALVDSGAPIGTGEWDPKDPAPIQFSNGAWGVAAVKSSAPGPPLLFRHTLGGQDPLYWLSEVTVDTAGDIPAITQLSGTTALFYRKLSGSYKQVVFRTSTDSGNTWSAATQLTTEAVNIYHIQAMNVAGTVYVFWSRDDDSRVLQYRTSTDLANWSASQTVSQPIGPKESNTVPEFAIGKWSSGTWGLSWLDMTSVEAAREPGRLFEQLRLPGHLVRHRSAVRWRMEREAPGDHALGGYVGQKHEPGPGRFGHGVPQLQSPRPSLGLLRLLPHLHR